MHTEDSPVVSASGEQRTVTSAYALRIAVTQELTEPPCTAHENTLSNFMSASAVHLLSIMLVIRQMYMLLEVE